MYLQNRFILSLLLVVLLPILSHSQTLTNTFIDPCTKKVSVFVVPLQGTTIVFMGKAKFFTSADVQNGALMTWINQVYAEFSAPCPINQLTQQVTQQTVSATVSSAVSSAASSVAASSASVSVPSTPPPAPTSQPAPAQSSGSSGQSSSQSEGGSSSNSSESGGNSSESKSEGGSESKTEESKSDSKSESKKDEKKESKKEEKKKSNAKAGQTPLIFSSDLSAVNQLQGDFNLMANLGVSRASMAGDVSYGSTLTIFSNLKQFALSSRYSKMDIQNNSLCGIGTYSYTLAYNAGDLIHIGGYSYVMMNKSYIYGYALSLINTKIPFNNSSQQFWSSSIVVFGMHPIPYNKRVNITPEVFLMSSPLSYSSKSGDLSASNQIMYIFGSSFDLALSKRFKLAINVKYMGPVHTIGLQVGSRFNL